MITRIEIATRAGFRDSRGEQVRDKARGHLGIEIAGVRTRDVYLVEAELRDGEADKVVREFTDPVSQTGSLGHIADGDFDAVVHVGYKPGVTDPVGKSARVAVEDTLGRPLPGAAVYTSTLYLFRGIEVDDARRVALDLLANPLIQTIDVKSRDSWEADPEPRDVPKVQSHDRPAVKHVPLDGSDEDLERISREGLLALSLAEMTAIREHFLRAIEDPRRRIMGLDEHPTDVELECIAQTWSEHCKHKIFNATITYKAVGEPTQDIPSLFSMYIKGATAAIDRAVTRRDGKSWLVSVFHDNAGVVAFDDRQHLVYKVETHNSPSALDPYGGAITGIVGVNRDPFGTGLGADLLSNVWGYCFASPFYNGRLPEGLLHPRRIRDGVHQGVIDGGNQSGIPYGRGWELFDPRYLGKPLVFCGTVGALPVDVAGRPGEDKAARPGDLIVMTGGRIGADGIHGATFSSAALDESAPVQAVQIGDPITQKIMFDFLLQARDLGLYEAITDNGAGGLSSSVGEMARDPGGARLDLSRAPLKYAGLAPWEILVSEAQERMTLAVPPEKIDRFLDLARRRGVEATVLGEFTDDGYFHVSYGDETVALISMNFLHGGDPEMRLTATWRVPQFEEPPATSDLDLDDTLLAMLSRLNVCSGERKARHYDHEVKGLSVVRPYVGVDCDVASDASVFMMRHGSHRGYVLSEGVNPFYSDIDPHAMAVAVVDEAVRKQLCAGARWDRIALLDNFCWPDPVRSTATPDGEYKLAQLVRACKGLYEAATTYAAPLISGKDSMKNDSTMGGVKISVPPTLLVSAIGQIDDVRRAVTLDPKQAGDVLFLLGETRDECGGSEYFRYLGTQANIRVPLGQPQPYVGDRVPRLDPAKVRPMYQALAEAIERGWVRSASAPAKGGLGVTLCRLVMAAGLGLDVDLSPLAPERDLVDDRLLFSESCGRFVVTTSAEDAPAFADHFDYFPCRRIGTVTEEAVLQVRRHGRRIVRREIAALKNAYKDPLDTV